MSTDAGRTPEGLDLADAVELLREQIGEAQRRLADPEGGGDRGTVFALGEITVELSLELTRTTGGHAGLRWHVLSLGGKRETERHATHKLTVKLRPHLPEGGDVDISDDE